LHGAVNAVAPAPVTNQEFTRALGIVLKRPTLFSVPAFAVRILFGEMGRELLLSSNRVMPGRLLAAGFRFRFPEIEVALRHAISRKRMEPRV
jgi:NAD dependent epimerase/dehydratase family enzyme